MESVNIHTEKEIIESLELINGVDAVFLFRALSFNTSTMENETADLIWSIKTQTELFLFKNSIIDSSNIAITISTKNLNKIVDYHSVLTNQKLKLHSQMIKVYGYNILPSEAIQDDCILVGEISKIK